MSKYMYFLKRVVYIVFVFLIVSVILFLIYKAIPGDPARLAMEGAKDQLDPRAYEMMYQQARAKLGLDLPLPVQYVKWLANFLTGDLGYSIYYRMEVARVIQAPLVNTFLINIFNLVIVFAITIFLGITAALRKGKTYDNFVQVLSVLGLSLPSFIIAILFILVFAVRLKWFPVSGMYTPDFKGTSMEFIVDRAWYMALPLATLTFSSLGSLTRYVRTAMIEALSMDCIRTARAKGLKDKVVIYSHAFRNALIPVVTAMMGWFITIFSGSVVVEKVFLWNGMGKIMLDALNNQDFAVAMSLQMFYVIIALLGNLILDLVYGFVDPRVRLS